MRKPRIFSLLEYSKRKKDKMVQRVRNLDKVKPNKLKFPRLCSEKMDGCYCLALKYNERVTIYSRTGEIYHSMKHIEKLLFKTLLDEDIIIFEAYMPGVGQEEISGHCRDTKVQWPELEAACHQYLTLDEFVNGGKITATESYEMVKKKIKGLDPIIWAIPQYIINSLEEAMKIVEDIWDKGGEGLILRSLLCVFQGGKVNDSMLRIKQLVSYDLLVLDVKIGEEGKYEETLGALICRFKEGMTIDVSGMRDDQRHLWWDYPNLIIGKIVQVDGMKDSSKGKIREPRFKGIRYDKVVADF